MLGYSRKKINEYLEQSLSGVVSGRVSIGDPVADIGLPNITIMLDDELEESSAYMVTDDDPCERRATITIEARALLEDGTESPIDDLCWEIEQTILSATSLNDWCRDMVLESTEYNLDDDEFPIGLATLTYHGFYVEAQENTLSNIQYFRSGTTITLTCRSLFPSRMTVRALNLDTYVSYYSAQEPVATIHHTLIVDVGNISHGFLTSYIQTSEAYGLNNPSNYTDPPYKQDLIHVYSP